MADEEFRKERLNQVIDLARIYRGWTKGELANALGRDASNMMPESGNPKLDLVFGLAEVLDWPVGDVAESLCRQDEPRPGPGETFDSVNDESLAAHASGHYKGMLACAAKMLQLGAQPQGAGRRRHSGWRAHSTVWAAIRSRSNGCRPP